MLIFGGRHWKRPEQPSTDAFVQGDFQGTFFSWDFINQVGCSPSSRFGHSFVACRNFAFLYGGLSTADFVFQHVNTNVFTFSLLNKWDTRPSQLPPLAYHSATFIGQNIVAIIGGVQLDRTNRMIRPGQIHLVKFQGDGGAQTSVSTIDASLHISGHSIVELGDYLYVFGGYRASSRVGDAEPSQHMIRIHVPSLINGELNIHQEPMPPLFTSSNLYTSKQTLRKALIFNIEEQSVWHFNAQRPDFDDEGHDAEEVVMADEEVSAAVECTPVSEVNNIPVGL